MTPEQRLADAIERLGRAESAQREATMDRDVVRAEVAALRRHVDGDNGGRPVALTDRIVGLLEDGHQRTPKQIVDQLSQLGSSVDAASVRATLSQLAQSGRLVRPARGRYRAAPEAT